MVNKVIFTGKTEENTSIPVIREKLKNQFKLSDAHLDKVFSGDPFILKTTTDIEQAKKLYAWLTQLGMVCQLASANTEPNIDLDPIAPEEIEKPVTQSAATNHSLNIAETQSKLITLGKLLLQFPSIKTFTILLVAIAAIQLAIGPIRSNTLGPLVAFIDAIAVLIMTLASFSIIVSAMYRDITIRDVIGFLLNTGKSLLHTPEPSIMAATAIANLSKLPIKTIVSSYVKYSLWGLLITALVVTSGVLFKESGSEAAYYILIVIATVIGFALGNWIPPYQSVALFIPNQRLPLKPFILVSLIQTIALVTISALLIQTVANDDARLIFAVAAIIAWCIYVLVVTRFAWGLAKMPPIYGEPVPIRKYYGIATGIAVILVVIALAIQYQKSKQQDMTTAPELNSAPELEHTQGAKEAPSTSFVTASDWDKCSEQAASSADPGYGRAGIEAAIDEQCGSRPTMRGTPANPMTEAINEAPYDLVSSDYWNPKFRAVTGAHYDQFVDALATAAPVEDGEIWITARGCAASQCTMRESAFAINKKTGAILAVFMDSPDIQGFGFQNIDEAPEFLQRWVKEKQVQ